MSDNARSAPSPRRTLANAVSIEGTGIHSGAPCRVRLVPADEIGGVRFRRDGRPPVIASLDTADPELSDRRTVIVGPEGERFEQIEHLMAALAAAGITDLIVEQQGPEVPFLGGGSKEYLEAIHGAGNRPLDGEQPVLTVTRPTTFQDGNALFHAAPHDGLRLTVFVEFPGTPVGCAGFSLEVTEESFLREAAPARTFALAEDIEKLWAAGLAKGGSLTNAVVFDQERYHNDFLHFPDEVVRHKSIDLLGDLALTGSLLRGHFWAWRGGHRGHIRFARHLAGEFLC